MQTKEHHIQDALEPYAVALLQEMAEAAGVAITHDSASKFAAFQAYAQARRLTDFDFTNGQWSVYKRTVDTHMPVFFERLIRTLEGQQIDFDDVEARYRNANLKGDFLIRTSAGHDYSVSMKNYRGSALRPQLSSGTYNSFILGFLFEARGVGSWVDPETGAVFRGSKVSARDTLLDRMGIGHLVPMMHQLDELNISIKRRFVESPTFEYLDGEVFRAAARECGDTGAALAEQLLRHVPPDRLKTRLLKMTGMDGQEETLIMDPERFTDSLTVKPFRDLRDALRAPATVVDVMRRGQGLRFVFRSDGLSLLSVDVPFTINKNGAWISGPPYVGVQYHEKEGMNLAWGQRRPKKSRELATSINTYADFTRLGVFVEVNR